LKYLIAYLTGRLPIGVGRWVVFGQQYVALVLHPKGLGQRGDQAHHRKIALVRVCCACAAVTNWSKNRPSHSVGQYMAETIFEGLEVFLNAVVQI